MREPLIIHITGARPNFPKAAPVMRALDAYPVRQELIHTGQHYDELMSDVFFRELGIPTPVANLAIGSGKHGAQTATAMIGLEQEFTERQPDLVMVYGDVNSTVAAALVAVKMHIPVAHVEAGLRSFDRYMPEEINRIVTDQLSDLLLVTSPDAIAHLSDEGVPWERIHLVGNPMIDTLLASIDKFDNERIRETLGVTGDYAVATIHRPVNVDDAAQRQLVVAALHRIADQIQVVIPLHPRGRAAFAEAGLDSHPGIMVTEPLGYLDFMSLVRGATVVVTDSGGVQEETTVLGVPCLTLRENTERPVTITHGTNQLVNVATVADAVADTLAHPDRTYAVPPLWDGHSAERIAKVVNEFVYRGATN